MILVMAYPPGYAVVLSLYNYRLTDPGGREFVGLNNYWDPARRRVVERLHDHFIITVVTVAIELVVGFIFACDAADHPGRGPLRTAILIPYGIVTVVSAFIWRYAFALDSGFVNQWFGLTDFNWFGDRWSALFVISPVGDLEDHTVHLLLLLAGLVQVSEDMQEAAKVDNNTGLAATGQSHAAEHEGGDHGRPAVPHFDAWRIFDNLFVMTRGANNTETISFLIYRQNVTLVNLGMGWRSRSCCSSAWSPSPAFRQGFKTDPLKCG